MPFMIVQRTWGPDTVPRSRGSDAAALSVDVVDACESLREAEKLAKTRAASFPANGYNPKQDYWWGRVNEFRYTLTVEGPRRYPPIARQHSG